MANNRSVAIIGGRQHAKIAVSQRFLKQPDDDPAADQEVVRLQDFEARSVLCSTCNRIDGLVWGCTRDFALLETSLSSCRTGANPRKRHAKGKTHDPDKKIKLKSDEQWVWEQSQQADESSITDLCRSQACSSHLLVSDVCERIRSGRLKVDTVPVRLHPVAATVDDTDAATAPAAGTCHKQHHLDHHGSAHGPLASYTGPSTVCFFTVPRPGHMPRRAHTTH